MVKTAGEWQWVDGESFNYARWWKGTPKRTGEAYRYASYWNKRRKGQFWVNVDNTHVRSGYVLEYVESAAAVNMDTDGDGLADFAEMQLGSNPYVVDTDGDGLNDL